MESKYNRHAVSYFRAKLLKAHPDEFITDKHAIAHMENNPEEAKEEFEAFISKVEAQYLKDNPFMWPSVKAELEEALETL